MLVQCCFNSLSEGIFQTVVQGSRDLTESQGRPEWRMQILELGAAEAAGICGSRVQGEVAVQKKNFRNLQKDPLNNLAK